MQSIKVDSNKTKSRNGNYASLALQKQKTSLSKKDTDLIEESVNEEEGIIVFEEKKVNVHQINEIDKRKTLEKKRK